MLAVATVTADREPATPCRAPHLATEEAEVRLELPEPLGHLLPSWSIGCPREALSSLENRDPSLRDLGTSGSGSSGRNQKTRWEKHLHPH